MTIQKLKTGVKKFQATFKLNNGKEKKTSFGASGYTDYTLSGDKKKRDAYRKRHKKDLNTKDPMRAGFLSYYILWGDSTNLQTNIKSYKKRFGL